MNEQVAITVFLVGFLVLQIVAGGVVLWLSRRDIKRQREGYGLG